MTEYKKKLIEVALPLDAINAASERENYIYRGNPSGLHKWWAQRPLAACRAVLFAQLVDDPSAHPDRFPTEEDQDRERERLFNIIGDLVLWENTTAEEVLERARAEIRRSCGGSPPPILDPFAGGGTIPLEAQRLGLDAHASDLNPVAVLINKALIEIPPRWADHPPVHPEADRRMSWKGAQGLAEDVRRYGHWMRDEAERRIGHLYPKAKLPDGGEATVIAWIWARTVACPNPGCGATMPLASSFWLSKKKDQETWVKPVVEGKTVRFEIGHGPVGPPDSPKVGRGAKFDCLVCGESASEAHVKAEGMAGRMGAQLMAIAAEGDRRRVYLPPNDEHVAAADVSKPHHVASQEVPDEPRSIWCKSYGLTTWADLFTNRQLILLATLSDLIGEAQRQIREHCHETGPERPEAQAYASAITTYLAFVVSKLADYNCTGAVWYPQEGRVKNLFARQAIPMVWDFPENNPFHSVGGSFERCVEVVVGAMEALPIDVSAGRAQLADARCGCDGMVVATDPPYYDNIGYADLSDFFYVWLRRSLGETYPDLFATLVTPKNDELIALPVRHGGSRSSAEKYFEDGFVDVFHACLTGSPADYPMTVFYAFKQASDSEAGTIASTGWSTMLEGLARAGWMVTATWPMRTERGSRTRAIESNALASSVVLACRRRPLSAGIADRQGLIRTLQVELPAPLRELQKANIAPVDLRQAAIGPGMAIFSRFAKVVEPDGSPMRVHTALGLINQVLDQVLDEQMADFDAETRWATQWFASHWFDEGPYGTAEQLAVSMNIAVSSMVDSGILRSGGGKVCLLDLDDLPADWDPTADSRTPVWEATHHLVKRLFEDGETAAGQLARQLGGLAESARQLAYHLYTICERPKPALAGPYNALVASWPEIQRLAQSEPVPTAPEQQSFST